MLELWTSLIREAEKAWAAGYASQALQLCDQAALASPSAIYHAALLRGDVLMSVGDVTGALCCYETAANRDQPDPQVDCARGVALFELCRFPEAEYALQSAIRQKPDLAPAHFSLGLLYEITQPGREVEHFRKARRLDAFFFGPKPQLAHDDFNARIDAALVRLEVEARQNMNRIQLVVQQVPSVLELTNTKVFMSPRTPGLCRPLAQPKPELMIYKRNLERICASPEAMILEIVRVMQEGLRELFGS